MERVLIDFKAMFRILGRVWFPGPHPPRIRRAKSNVFGVLCGVLSLARGCKRSPLSQAERNAEIGRISEPGPRLHPFPPVSSFSLLSHASDRAPNPPPPPPSKLPPPPPVRAPSSATHTGSVAGAPPRRRRGPRPPPVRAPSPPRLGIVGFHSRLVHHRSELPRRCSTTPRRGPRRLPLIERKKGEGSTCPLRAAKGAAFLPRRSQSFW